MSKSDLLKSIRDTIEDDEQFILIIAKKECKDLMQVGLVSDMDYDFAMNIIYTLYVEATMQMSPTERARYESVTKTKH